MRLKLKTIHTDPQTPSAPIDIETKLGRDALLLAALEAPGILVKTVIWVYASSPSCQGRLNQCISPGENYGSSVLKVNSNEGTVLRGSPKARSRKATVFHLGTSACGGAARATQNVVLQTAQLPVPTFQLHGYRLGQGPPSIGSHLSRISTSAVSSSRIAEAPLSTSASVNDLVGNNLFRATSGWTMIHTAELTFSKLRQSCN